MLHKHIYFTFTTLLQFPGEDLHGLAQRIRELHGTAEGMTSLLYGEDHLMLEARLRALDYCVEEREGRYFFNPQAQRYSYHDEANTLCADILRTREQQRQRYAARPRQE